MFVLFLFCLLQCLFVLCLEHNDISLCVLSPISDYHTAWIIVTTLTEILTSHNILPLHGTANCSLATCGIGTLLNIHIQLVFRWNLPLSISPSSPFSSSSSGGTEKTERARPTSAKTPTLILALTLTLSLNYLANTLYGLMYCSTMDDEDMHGL